ncbi:MAG: ABC transporter permease [Solirubrobacterales bacterium]
MNTTSVAEYSRAELGALAQRMPQRVKGPRAVSGTVKRFLLLTWMLAYLEFKLKFFGSVLGYAWQLVRPLLMFSVLYLVFTVAFNINAGVSYAPVVLLSAIVLFTFFSDSTVGAIASIVDRESLIRKISFPIIAVPLSTVTSVFLTVLLNYLVVVLLALVSGVTPTLRWLEVLPLLGLLYLVSASVGVALSAYYVRYRDVMPIWEVIAQVLFYASPIIYTIEYVQQHAGETVARLMMCNPVTTIIEQMRHAMIDPSAPSAGQALGGWIYLLIPMGLVVALTVFGYVSMRRLAPRVAEEL